MGEPGFRDDLVDFREKSDEELKHILEALCEEEEQISFRRRVLHGKIDMLRAELVDRMKSRHARGESVISGLDIDRLSEILAKGFTGVKKTGIG